MTYILTLNPPLVEVNEDLVRLLHEALALADADDQALTSKASQAKHAASLTGLRTVCVQLLSAAMSTPEFSNDVNLNATRFRIVQVFFKSLYTKAPEVTEAAKIGLRLAISNQNKLPKDLLQTGLRPILLNLSDPKRLTIDGLQGLASLLELLTNYFKVEIGRKLLDHLIVWSAPQAMEVASLKLLSESHDVNIIVHILEIIHLLPAAAIMFMEDMVKQVVRLENALHRYRSSPFRAPLAKFLNRFADESVNYLAQHLDSPEIGLLFVDLIGDVLTPKFQQSLVDNMHILLDAMVDVDADSWKMNNFICLIKELCHQRPTWIATKPEVVSFLSEFWRLERQSVGEVPFDAPLPQLYRRKHLAHTFVSFCTNNHNSLDVLFDLVDIFTVRNVVDYSFVKEFFLTVVALQYTLVERRAVFEFYLNMLAVVNIDAKKKVYAMRIVVIPLLVESFKIDKEDQLISGDILNLICSRVWLWERIGHETTQLENLLKLEFIQLTSLLIRHIPAMVSEHRKEIIKFAWGFMKHEDVITKQSA